MLSICLIVNEHEHEHVQYMCSPAKLVLTFIFRFMLYFSHCYLCHSGSDLYNLWPSPPHTQCHLH